MNNQSQIGHLVAAGMVVVEAAGVQVVAVEAGVHQTVAGDRQARHGVPQVAQPLARAGALEEVALVEVALRVGADQVEGAGVPLEAHGLEVEEVDGVLKDIKAILLNDGPSSLQIASIKVAVCKSQTSN